MSLDPNPFHSALAVHTHRNCACCHLFQRCEFKQLLQCARCKIVSYCSKECQRSHWPEHKLQCNEIIREDKELLAQTGIPHAYTDLMKWMEFYSTPLKNCLVAALNLPEYPHQERNSALYVILTHKRDLKLPIEKRFTIDSINRKNRNDYPQSCNVSLLLDHPSVRQASQFGKKEMGKDYYGTALYIAQAEFAPNVKRMAFRCFSIDKTVARAKVMDGPWWPPLRYILENGQKMRFCCGKIEGGGCCCGGWAHEKGAPGDVLRP